MGNLATWTEIIVLLLSLTHSVILCNGVSDITKKYELSRNV
jgi:hypothetical protein